MVRSRGQLLLIGAVLIGMTIVGTVVMLNGMQYADSAGTQSQRAVLDDAELTEQMVERDMARLTFEVIQSDTEEPWKALRENISAYDNYRRNVTASRGGSTVNVTLNRSASDGWILNQSSTSDFQCQEPSGTCPSPRKNWAIVNDTTLIHQFTLTTASVSGNPSNALTVHVTNASGREWELKMVSDPPSSAELTVQEKPGDPPINCRSTGDQTVELDLIDGTATNTDSNCEFRSFTEVMEPPYNVSILNGNKGTGTYELIVHGSVDDGKYEGDNARNYPVAPGVDFEYRSSELAYNRTLHINSTRGGP